MSELQPIPATQKPTREVDTVVIRFAGDSGDGMQVTGSQFTTVSALAGNDISTLPDFPAEIRAPAGTLAGVSGFQLSFSRREVSSILLYGLAIEVSLAIPVGLWLGRLWAERFMQSVDQETFRWQVSIAPRTYLLVVTVVVLAAVTSALWVRRNVDRLDLVAVLKSKD